MYILYVYIEILHKVEVFYYYINKYV